MNEFELHPDRLTTTDEKGSRIFVHPADVKGYFRRHRDRVQFVLMLIFLVLPWVRIGGEQALLLDLAHRKFEIFGLSLRAHNVPLLFLVFAAAGFGLFAATAVFGRVRCGWACPQTVFIDGVYRRIERWIEGPALERRRLDKAPWTAHKAFKRTLKWALYVLATLVITHSFLAYFVGTENLAEMITRPPAENWGSFLFMVISSAIILFDFAWFREQFCTIVCPYGRFQSVLMDKSSMIVAYDVARGEPRATGSAKALAKAHGSRLGDCVNCYRCVQVCPTGIDIRRGLQMECIACTSCIDACDDVMTKLKKPTGLIRYDSLLPKGKTRRFSARAAIYTTLCVAALVALGVLLSRFKPIDVQILRAKDSPYSVQSDSTGKNVVTNHLKLEVSNQSGTSQSLMVVSDHPDVQIVIAILPIVLAEGELKQIDVFARFPQSLLTNGKKPFSLSVRPVSQANAPIIREVMLVGPFE